MGVGKGKVGEPLLVVLVLFLLRSFLVKQVSSRSEL